jgi:hypothetical protein
MECVSSGLQTGALAAILFSVSAQSQEPSAPQQDQQRLTKEDCQRVQGRLAY